MNIVFWADCYTEHQRQLSEELNKQATSFIFVVDNESEKVDSLIGKKAEYEPCYVLHIDSNYSKATAKQLISNADVIVAGRVPLFVFRECIKQNKLFLRYSERPLKLAEGTAEHFFRSIKWRITQPVSPDMYLLAAGAYAAYDYSKYGMYEGKAYKWGYFPEFAEYEIDHIIQKKKKRSIVWAGRLIDWKHPEICIELARSLKEYGFEFEITIAGDGPLRKQLEDACRKYNLLDCISLTGSIAPRQVRKLMEQTAIHICTSDRQEGWGAVVNEAMNSGCAVVANRMIGSVPFLITNSDNGYVYNSPDELAGIVAELLSNESECRRIGLNAYQTIENEWNAITAAERLIRLSECLLQGKESPFETGPCSKAELICEE